MVHDAIHDYAHLSLNYRWNPNWMSYIFCTMLRNGLSFASRKLAHATYENILERQKLKNFRTIFFIFFLSLLKT